MVLDGPQTFAEFVEWVSTAVPVYHQTHRGGQCQPKTQTSQTLVTPITYIETEPTTDMESEPTPMPEPTSEHNITTKLDPKSESDQMH